MDDANDHLSIDITEPEELMDDEVFIDIMKKLVLVQPVSEKNPGPFIGRVPQYLRDVNADAYEPQIIAIGPYHRRNKSHLQGMEKHKLVYFEMLLQRRGKDGVKRYVEKMRELEERARECYIDAVCLNRKEFVEMMLLDSCFIVGLFRKYHSMVNGMDTETKYYDLAFHTYRNQHKLRRDLLLAENQIPFFVLDAFFEMTETQDERNNFLEIIFSFFNSLLPYQRYEQGDYHFNIKEIKHLLSFVHDSLVHPVVRKLRIGSKVLSPCATKLKVAGIKFREVLIPCATKLKQAGIEFRVAANKALFDIEFQNGIITIPKLVIGDDIESFFRNLIVYEQMYPKESNPVVEYMNFMTCLINSKEDVGLLCRSEIVDNLLGDEKVVAKIFNRSWDYGEFSCHNHYTKIYTKVGEYCGRRHTKWRTILSQDYFNTPMASISFQHGVLLLLLTFLQTVFSVLAYHITNK